MTLIEGVGDEVTICLLVLLILAVLALAWVSTHVSELGTVNVIVVDRQGFQRLLQRISNLTGRNIQVAPREGQSEQDTDPAASTSSEPRVEEVTTTPSEESESESGEPAQADGGLAHDNIEDEATIAKEELPATNSVDTLHVTEPADTSAIDDAVDQPVADTPHAVLQPENILSRELLCKSRLAFFEKQASNDTVENIAESDRSEPLEPVEVHDDTDSVAAEISEHGAVASPAPSCVPAPEASSSDTSTPSAEDEEEQLEGHIRIRLKYLNESQRLVQAKPEDTVGEFKRRHFAAELAENLLVRCIFNGQELRPDSSTLQSYNISDRSIIHCLSQARPEPEQSNVPERPEWDIGALMFPLFGLILLLVWYSRFTYRTYFNAMSTFSLIGITLMYVVAILATWRTHEPHAHQE